jgi:hypothetical protein
MYDKPKKRHPSSPGKTMPRMITKPEGKPLIVLLVKRAVFFLFGLCLLCLFLYCIGTVQDFLDSTQIAILNAASGLGLLLGIGAAYGFVLDIGAASTLKAPRYLLGAFAYFFLAVTGISVAGLASFILVAISGNAP